MSSEDTHYPDLYISDVDDAKILDLPEKGTATIKFRVVSRRHEEEKAHDGKKRRRCSVRLEVLSIEVPDNKENNKPTWLDSARKSFKDNFK